MSHPEPGVPAFCLEFVYLFVRCNPLALASELKKTLHYKTVGEGCGRPLAAFSERTLRLIAFERSEWTAIVPVDTAQGGTYIEDAVLPAVISQSLLTDCVFLANSDTAVVLIYKHFLSGKVVASLEYGEDEDSDEVKFAPVAHPRRAEAMKSPYAFVDQAVREQGIILPQIMRFERAGDLLLPAEELFQGHERFATVLTLQQEQSPT